MINWHNNAYVKVLSYNKVRKHKAARTLVVKRARGTSSASRLQRRVSLAGAGSDGSITNWRQVASAMAKWA